MHLLLLKINQSLPLKKKNPVIEKSQALATYQQDYQSSAPFEC